MVLSRKKDEKIRIGRPGELYRKEGGAFVPVSPIDVMVIEIRGDKTRLGINADKAVSIHRDEVWSAIDREAAAAGKAVTT